MKYGILNLNSKWTLFLVQESDEDSVASSAAEKNIIKLFQSKKKIFVEFM